MTMAPVAVVVLSYEGREDTLACLESLAAVERPTILPIVVDNASQDGTAAAVAERFPDAVLIRSAENLGYAGGNNLGIRHALELGAGHVLVLNNDAVIAPDAVGQLVDEAERRPQAGALCPLIYYADPPDLVWWAGRDFDPRRGYHGHHRGWREPDDGTYAEVQEVGTAVGAAMLLPAGALREVGLFDEGLYLYVEDVDLSLRLRAAGLRIYLVPAAKAWHRVSAASGSEQAEDTAYYLMRNTLEVCARHAPLRGPRALARHLEAVAVNVVHARRASRPVRNVRAVLQGRRHQRLGLAGPRRAPYPRDHRLPSAGS